MGSIINRDGKWRAQVRRVGHKAQCRTFTTKAQAERWVRSVETDIDAGRSTALSDPLTVGDFIRAYRKMRDEARPISDTSTEHYTLKTLDAHLGSLRVAAMTAQDLVGFAVKRRDDGAGPYTVNMDISKLGTVLRYGAAVLRVTAPDLVGQARPLLNHLRLIGGGGKRERRPTDDELVRLYDHLRDTRGLVYAEGMLFAAASAMRRGEIVALKWTDLDDSRCASVLRKHPRLGKTLEKVPLIGPAWEIVQRQPRVDERIFPMHESTLSKYFTWACRDLSIPDLNFHDLRHEGTSRLFEEGYSIEQVALVTGHKDWRHLRRYTNLRPESLTQPERASGQGGRTRRGSPQTVPSLPYTSSPGKSRR